MEFALICVTNYTGNVWLLDDSQGWPKYYIQIERRILYVTCPGIYRNAITTTNEKRLITKFEVNSADRNIKFDIKLNYITSLTYLHCQCGRRKY